MRLLIILSYSLFAVVQTYAAQDQNAALMLYNGAWQVTRQGSAGPDKLVNQCAKVGHYFTCDQSVNGGPSALLVFIPRIDKPGQYYTQNIRPEGHATSRGDLIIEGDTWTFLSSWNDGGHTTYYRTVNTFSGKSRIKYEQSESLNNKDWKVTNSGEETRTSGRN